jgi:hypothetical protein
MRTGASLLTVSSTAFPTIPTTVHLPAPSPSKVPESSTVAAAAATEMLLQRKRKRTFFMIWLNYVFYEYYDFHAILEPVFFKKISTAFGGIFFTRFAFWLRSSLPRLLAKLVCLHGKGG